MDANGLKYIMAQYLRYDLACPILALECPSRLASSYNDGGAADLLAVNKKRQLIEVEVKISLADLRADRKKAKHEYYRKLHELPYKNKQRRFGQEVSFEPLEYPTNLFYFAVPWELANKAKLMCEDIYPYAGLLSNQENWYGAVTVNKSAKELNPQKITLKQATILAKSQSATLVRLLETITNMESRAR